MKDLYIFYRNQELKFLEILHKNNVKCIEANGLCIYKIDTLPEMLEELSLVEFYPLKSLIFIPKCLRILHLYETNISSIGILPDTLQILSICYSPIVFLPPLPDNIKRIDLYDTKIRHLDTLPESLIYLDIYYCKFLDKIPHFPQNLQELKLYKVNVSFLHPFPKSLKNLSLRNLPFLSKIPKLPNLIEFRYCSRLKEYIIPRLPDTLEILDIRNTKQDFDNSRDLSYLLSKRLPKMLQTLILDISELDYTKTRCNQMKKLCNNSYLRHLCSKKISRSILQNTCKKTVYSKVIEMKTESWILIPYHQKCINFGVYMKYIK
ncbi:MAG TPA: hypothetical protein V6C58_17420 [Allocoleopsis sp.]